MGIRYFLKRTLATLRGGRYDYMADYDMYALADEQFYRELYLQLIGRFMPAAPAAVLDAGCAQGRLTIPLRQRQYAVTGVDCSPAAIAAARRHATEAGVTQDGFHIADLPEFLAAAPAGVYDAVLCLEVLYTEPRYREIISGFGRLLRPGGVLFIALRNAYYYPAHFTRLGRHDLAARAAESTEVRDGDSYYKYFTAAEATACLAAAGMSVSDRFGIGVVSGLEGDPQGALARPALLDDAARTLLAGTEQRLAAAFPDAGRYTLYVARKND